MSHLTSNLWVTTRREAFGTERKTYTMNTYKDRNVLLLQLGYNSYDEYLQSPLWYGIRKRGFEYHGKVCMLCKGTAVALHHIGYGMDVLTGKCLDSLAPLCNECHVKVEFRTNGNKRTLVGAQTAYGRLYKKAKYAASKDKTGSKLHLRGYCQVCGKLAKKKQGMCRPCQKRASKDQSPDVWMKRLAMAISLAALPQKPNRKKVSKPWIGLAHKKKHLRRKYGH